MIATDEDALICDLAETYKIFDYRALPVSLLATLSLGLSDSSRIKMKLSGQTQSFDRLLLAGITDRLSMIAWALSPGNENRPASLFAALTGGRVEDGNDVQAYRSAADFEAERERLLKGGN